MISLAEARALVEQRLFTYEALPDDDAWVLIPESTVERNFGWVFFYNSRKFLETGDLQFAQAGNAPLLVKRDSGEIVVLGTAYPVEHYITEYEKRTAPNT
ncbi:YrhB domain-containing protein [Pseudoduganella sp. HUAS MS19]